jgi:hypothetical protein
MKRRRETFPIACCAAALPASTPTGFWRDSDQDHRPLTLGAFVMRSGSWQTSSDMSLYIMFAGKVALLALALTRLG